MTTIDLPAAPAGRAARTWAWIKLNVPGIAVGLFLVVFLAVMGTITVQAGIGLVRSIAAGDFVLDSTTLTHLEQRVISPLADDIAALGYAVWTHVLGAGEPGATGSVVIGLAVIVGGFRLLALALSLLHGFALAPANFLWKREQRRFVQNWKPRDPNREHVDIAGIEEGDQVEVTWHEEDGVVHTVTGPAHFSRVSFSGRVRWLEVGEESMWRTDLSDGARVRHLQQPAAEPATAD